MATETADTQGKTVRDFNRIEIHLTFEDWPVMEFAFRRSLSKELRETKQVFLGLNEKEQAEAQPKYRVETLAGVLLEFPKNVPNLELAGAMTKEQQFSEYFSKDENQELLDWVFTAYQAKLYPKELLS